MTRPKLQRSRQADMPLSYVGMVYGFTLSDRADRAVSGSGQGCNEAANQFEAKAHIGSASDHTFRAEPDILSVIVDLRVSVGKDCGPAPANTLTSRARKNHKVSIPQLGSDLSETARI